VLLKLFAVLCCGVLCCAVRVVCWSLQVLPELQDPKVNDRPILKAGKSTLQLSLLAWQQLAGLPCAQCNRSMVMSIWKVWNTLVNSNSMHVQHGFTISACCRCCDSTANSRGSM